MAFIIAYVGSQMAPYVLSETVMIVVTDLYYEGLYIV